MLILKRDLLWFLVVSIMVLGAVRKVAVKRALDKLLDEYITDPAVKVTLASLAMTCSNNDVAQQYEQCIYAVCTVLPRDWADLLLGAYKIISKHCLAEGCTDMKTARGYIDKALNANYTEHAFTTVFSEPPVLGTKELDIVEVHHGIRPDTGFLEICNWSLVKIKENLAIKVVCQGIEIP